MLGNLLLERRGLLELHTVDVEDDVALADARFGGGTAVEHARHVDAAQLVDAQLLALTVEEGLVDRTERDTQHGALHDAVLLEVHDHLADNRFGHGERIAHVAARLRLDERIDAHQLTVRVDQRTARVAGVDRRIGLDEGFDAELARDDAQLTRLGTHDAGRDGRLQVVGRADGQHPFAQTQRVGAAEGERRKVLALDLDERHVGRRVRADDFGIEDAAVVELHAQFGGILDDVVVGHDVAVGRDNHARAASTALLLLRFAAAVEAPLRDAEEFEEGVIAEAAAAHLDLLYRLDVDHCLDGILRRIGQVGIAVRFVRREVGAERRRALHLMVDIGHARFHVAAEHPGRGSAGSGGHGNDSQIKKYLFHNMQKLWFHSIRSLFAS